MVTEREIFGEDKGGQEKSLVSSSGSGIERVNDPEIDDLIKLLSYPTDRFITTDESLENMAKRQEAVGKHLLRAGVDTLRRFFAKIKQMETEMRQPIKIDLSMLEVSGKILSGLYLPGANLKRLIFTESDLTGADLTGSNLTEAVGSGAILRGVIATGANFNSAVIPDADLSGGRFIGCSFINCVMSNIAVDKDTNFAGCRFIGTYLGNSDISSTNSVGAVFRGIRR